MTLVCDGGWRLWVAKGFSARYYYIAHTECPSGRKTGASCGMVAINARPTRGVHSCHSCYTKPPSEMMGMIKLIEWDK